MAEARPATGGMTRRCPVCDAPTDEALCPFDRTATILANHPGMARGPLRPGDVVAQRYELEREIGRGGFGTVFAARHLGTGQRVALKVLARHEDPIATRRFLKEAQVTSGLRHPNTIRVFDFGQDESGSLYFAMELLNGRTLAAEIRRRQRGVFAEEDAAEIGVAILKSLNEAHKAGLVHRDIKPDNIFLHQVSEDEGTVIKVLDFGIVKQQASQQELTSMSAIPGTPAYMSPEHALNQELDGRSDLYSVGVLLFQLVAGRLPFSGQGHIQTLYMHVHLPVPDLRQIARAPLSDPFIEVINRALKKSPQNRFLDAKEMRGALEQCLSDGRRSNTSEGAIIPSLHPGFAQIVPVEETVIEASYMPTPMVSSDRLGLEDEPTGAAATVPPNVAVLAPATAPFLEHGGSRSASGAVVSRRFKLLAGAGVLMLLVAAALALAISVRTPEPSPARHPVVVVEPTTRPAEAAEPLPSPSRVSPPPDPQTVEPPVAPARTPRPLARPKKLRRGPKKAAPEAPAKLDDRVLDVRIH